jgi:hypothetical protein
MSILSSVWALMATEPPWRQLTVHPRVCQWRRFAQWTRPFLTFAAILFLVSPSWASVNEPMYRCDDGTFTNIPERMCTPYEPKGTVLVKPEGATLASMRALLGEPTPKTSQLPDPPSICNLYQEWQMLNLRSGGGVTFANTQDVPRWMSLSRIFTAIGAPYCP